LEIQEIESKLKPFEILISLKDSLVMKLESYSKIIESNKGMLDKIGFKKLNIYFQSERVLKFRDDTKKNMIDFVEEPQGAYLFFFKVSNKPNSGLGSTVNVFLSQWHFAIVVGRQFHAYFD
jgi:hypothetical protein